jgi:hypothetical protein
MRHSNVAVTSLELNAALCVVSVDAADGAANAVIVVSGTDTLGVRV